MNGRFLSLYFSKRHTVFQTEVTGPNTLNTLRNISYLSLSLFSRNLTEGVTFSTDTALQNAFEIMLILPSEV
jgi:hypothetical protein